MTANVDDDEEAEKFVKLDGDADDHLEFDCIWRNKRMGAQELAHGRTGTSAWVHRNKRIFKPL